MLGMSVGSESVCGIRIRVCRWNRVVPRQNRSNASSLSARSAHFVLSTEVRTLPSAADTATPHRSPFPPFPLSLLVTVHFKLFTFPGFQLEFSPECYAAAATPTTVTQTEMPEWSSYSLAKENPPDPSFDCFPAWENRVCEKVGWRNDLCHTEGRNISPLMSYRG